MSATVNQNAVDQTIEAVEHFIVDCSDGYATNAEIRRALFILARSWIKDEPVRTPEEFGCSAEKLAAIEANVARARAEWLAGLAEVAA